MNLGNEGAEGAANSVEDDIRQAFDAVEKGGDNTGIADKDQKPLGDLYSDAADTDEEDDGAGDENQEDENQEDGDHEQTQSKDTSTEAPAHWPEADKQIFAKLDPAGKEFLLRRHKEMEADYTRKTQEIAPFKRLGEVATQNASYFDQIEQRYGERWQPEQAFQVLLNADKILRFGTDEQKNAAFLQIAKDYGINVGGMSKGNQDQNSEDDDFSDPEVKTLREKVVQLETKLGKFTQQQTSQQMQRLTNEVSAFANAKDEKGNFKHPYFEEVRQTMIRLANSYAAQGQDPTIQQVYDEAVWLVPSVREKLKAAERQAEIEAARAKAQKAKKASASVKTQVHAPAVTSKASKGRSVEDDIRLAFRQVEGQNVI